MTPTQFPQANRILKGPEGSDIMDLPSHTNGEYCISCWRMGWRERLTALLTGRVWLWVHSGHTQPPVCVTLDDPRWTDPDVTKRAEQDLRTIVRAMLKRARKTAK